MGFANSLEGLMNILVVDDDEHFREMVKKLLECAGLVTVAKDGIDAIQRIQDQLKEGQHFHLMCVDINMPRMDGMTFLKRVRAFERAANIEKERETKILMMTGFGSKVKEQAAITQGCNAFIDKPFRVEEFHKTLSRIGINLT
jgi:two-component system chemotaxis response regulator CheY